MDREKKGYAQPHGSSSNYVIGVDLETSGERSADNAVISVLKLVDLESGAYMKKLVYMRSYHAGLIGGRHSARGIIDILLLFPDTPS